MLKINDKITLLTRDDIINGLGVCKNTILKWEKNGLLSIDPSARTKLYYASEVHDYIKENDLNIKQRRGRTR